MPSEWPGGKDFWNKLCKWLICFKKENLKGLYNPLENLWNTVVIYFQIFLTTVLSAMGQRETTIGDQFKMESLPKSAWQIYWSLFTTKKRSGIFASALLRGRGEVKVPLLLPCLSKRYLIIVLPKLIIPLPNIFVLVYTPQTFLVYAVTLKTVLINLFHILCTLYVF